MPENDVLSPSATLWLLDGSQLRDEDLTSFAVRLSASEARRFANFARPTRRRQFLLGRMLLRFAVADLTGLSASKLSVLELSPHKPPQLIFPDGQRLAPNFSLSHSGEWVACVISSEATLGLDIEVNKPNRDLEAISEIAFHPREHIWFVAQPSVERVSAFYSLWCAREALFKLLCNLGCETEVSPLAGDENAGILQNNGRHRYQLQVPDLTVVVFSDRPLPVIHQRLLTGLSPADWLVKAENSLCPLSE